MTSSATVNKFLKDHYVEGAFHSHVSLIKPHGKFQLNREDIENFWNMYCKLLIDDQNIILGLAERPQHYLPVLVDLDIKLLEDNICLMENQEHLYNELQVQKVIEIYQSVLSNIVEDCSDENLVCVLLEKPVYKITSGTKSYVKSGFHLAFMSCFLSKIDQEVHVIPRVKQLMTEGKIFEDLGIENSGDLIDASCCKVNWLIYGCRKDEKMDPYRVSKVYNSECEEIDLEEAFKHYKIYDSREQVINIRGKVKEYLPRILSILPYGRNNCELKCGLESPIKQQNQKKESEKKYVKVSVTEALKVSRKLLPMLASYRAEDRNEWMNIGWVLYNISEGSSEGLEQWIDFSSRDEDKFDENVCIYEWEKMKCGDLTIGTLHHFAKKDNPELYQQYIDEITKSHVEYSLEGSDYDIAKILYYNYSSEFVCTDLKPVVWYQFSNHKWIDIQDGIYLRKRLSDEIIKVYEDMLKDIQENSIGCDKAQEAMFKVKTSQVKKIMQKLKTNNSKNAIMKEAADLFYNKHFREKLNTNPYIIAFKNGVYDLKSNVFRNGKPEDYLSKGLSINYVEFSEIDDKIMQVQDFFMKVFPDTSVRKYFLDNTSDIFVGGNYQKIVQFWLGCGDNSKSITQNILEKLFGELAIKFSTTLLTGKKGNLGAAAPELARAGDGVRLCTLEEPDGGEELNNGIFKSLSGNDSFFARDLFEKGKGTKEIIPLFKLIFITNKLPKFRHSDKATWNRVRVIPFEATFVRNPADCPDTFEEQLVQKRFPMDPHFSSKIPNLIEAFAWLLLEHRKNITTRYEPEKVLMATEMYKKQNDIFHQFIGECIIESSETFLSLDEIWGAMKEWYKDSFTNTLTLTKPDVKEYFIKLWDTPTCGNTWRGYKIRTLEDDLKSGQALELSPEDLVNYDS